ncbi:TPA: replication initiation protein RepM [Enterococcus faecalis]|nr:replication initiation protein RepM [Klebsiella oxytoca]
MKNKTNLVVKTNQLNQALQTLTLAEVRILQLAIVDARETGTGLSTDRPLRIDAMRYAQVFNTTRQNAYIRMKEAEETLFNRRFTYHDDDGKPIKSRWLQQVQYHDGEGGIDLVFTLAVVQGISRIDGLEQFFTSYLLEQTTQFDSVYSVRLYELLVQWRSMKHTPTLPLDTFRGQMGLGVNEYKAMCDFKKRVLDLAVDEINEKSDLKVSYEQEKKGRRITGFKFKVLPKAKPKKPKQDDNGRDSDTPDLFHQLTDKQINYFGAKLANDAKFGSKHAKVGEDVKAFEQRIKQELTNLDNQKKWADDLKRVGYSPITKQEG